MSGSSKILLGFILGGMMSVDMGGPFNKAAYVFGTASIAAGNYDIMAAVMIGGIFVFPVVGNAMMYLVALVIGTIVSNYVWSVWELDKKISGVSQLMSRFRGWIQAGAALLTNLHLPNFIKGGLYQGTGKTVCVPGLNCYSCPAASGACPIGAFQAVAGSSRFRFSYYVTGFLILLGVLLGRFICGFLCPFGWFQELLHKIPTKKLSTKKLKPLTYLKYVVLLVMVVLLPALVVNDVGMGDPFFCKYLCPQGVLEGAIPLSIANSGIRAALGSLFTWKFTILLGILVLSILFYRPFCKWLCPLGAFYALMNRVSLFQMKVDESKCVSCGKCAGACKMDVDVTKTPNHGECIRCGMCVRACPTGAVCFRYGFGDGKEAANETTKEAVNETTKKTTKKTNMEESK